MTTVKKPASNATVLEEMTPATRKVYDKVQAIVSAETENRIKQCYAVGKLVLSLTDEEAKYGSNPMGQLAMALYGDVKKADELYLCQKFAREYSEERITELLDRSAQHVKDNGGAPPVTLGHIKYLLSLQAPGKKASPERLNQLRMKYEAKIFAQKLTVKELAQEVKGKGTSRPGAGRGPTPPKTPKAGLNAMKQQCFTLSNKFDMWEEHVINPLSAHADDFADSELRELVEETESQLQALQDRVTEAYTGIQNIKESLGKAADDSDDDGDVADTDDGDDGDDGEADAQTDEEEVMPAKKKSKKSKKAKRAKASAA